MVVLHRMNHQPHIQALVISQELVLAMLELVLVVPVHTNRHPTVPRPEQATVDQVMLLSPLLMQTKMVSYPKVNFKLLDIRVRSNLDLFFSILFSLLR